MKCALPWNGLTPGLGWKGVLTEASTARLSCHPCPQEEDRVPPVFLASSALPLLPIGRACAGFTFQCVLRPQGPDVTPESENLTLSSSGAVDQSSCTGTPLSSTISSPEGT